MADLYDIAIIGAGPAGLCAARTILLQKEKPSVILIEKNTGIDKHIPCAEGVGKLGFHEVLEPKKNWIRSEVSHLTLHAPDNTTATYTDRNKGYIINRALMQHDLAVTCRDMGAEGLFSHTVVSAGTPGKDGARPLILDSGDALRARVVLDCSGPLSRFGANEKIHVKPLDLEVAYFAHVEGVATRTDTVHLYVGENVAPGGYAWAFPRNEENLNIGIVLGSSFRGTCNIKKMLESFIAAHYPQARVVRTCGGSIPCFRKKVRLATQGLIKAGDAISTVNPISRAGIAEAMKSGSMAGMFALRMLSASSEKEMQKICGLYEKAWNDKLGNRHLKLARVKRFLQKVTDKEYNEGAKVLSMIPQEKMTMSRIFKTCLMRFPQLVLALRHVM